MRVIFSLLLFLTLSKSIFSYEFRNQEYLFDIGAGLYVMDKGLTKISGLATSVKVGKNINDQISVYYFDFTSLDIGTSKLNRYGLNGIGSTYYLSPTVPSIYLMFGLGKGYSNIGDYSDSIFSRNDVGYMLGGGYEVSQKNHIELTLFSIKDISSVQFTVHRLFY